QLADGTGAVEQLTTNVPLLPTTITPDGKSVIGTGTVEQSISHLVAVSLEGDHKATELTHTTSSESNADISPDGRWIAYESNDSGQSEVYVQPCPNLAGGRWMVSNGGGTRPLWARTGRELFYVSANLRLMSVPLQPGDRFNPGTPVPITT